MKKRFSAIHPIDLAMERPLWAPLFRQFTDSWAFFLSILMYFPLRNSARHENIGKKLIVSFPALPPKSFIALIFILIFLTMITTGTTFFCSSASAFSIIGESKEMEIGQTLDEEIIKKYGYYKNNPLQDYVNGVGKKLVQWSEPRSFSYRFKVLDTEEENAFAIPGGYIYVTRGLLALFNSEAQLAGVIGHEIGHAASRHAAEMLTKSLGYQFLTLGALAAGAAGSSGGGNLAMVVSAMSQQVLLGYGRENELQADELGMLYSFKAGYDPKGIVEFMKTLKVKEKLKAIEYHAFMASHPDTAVRVMKLEDMAENYESRKVKYVVRSKEFKDQLHGLIYGPKSDGKKIKIVIAHQGDTLRDIAQKTMGSPVKAWNLALLNGLREDSHLEEGQLIKTITETD